MSPPRTSYFQSLFSSLSFAASEPDRIMSSDSTKHKSSKENTIPWLGVSPTYLWAALKLDLKVNLYAVAFTLITCPFLIMVMYVVHNPQFEAHLNLGYSTSASPPAPPSSYTQSETLFLLMGLNRLLWALWIINLRHWSTMTSWKVRKHTKNRLLPFIIEASIILVSYLSSASVRESRFLTVTVYSVAMYLGTGEGGW